LLEPGDQRDVAEEAVNHGRDAREQLQTRLQEFLDRGGSDFRDKYSDAQAHRSADREGDDGDRQSGDPGVAHAESSRLGKR
jgi:hypothetical protein